MAGILKANCKCGFETRVGFGWSRDGTFHLPVLCRECGKLGKSLYARNQSFIDAPTCEFCQSTNIVRYSDTELRADPPKETDGLTSGIHFCPQCKEFGLSFKDTGTYIC